MHENHAVCIDAYLKDMLQRKLSYILNNPVKEGVVENAIDYVYSGAGDYIGKKGLVKIDLLIQIWKLLTKQIRCS